MDKEKKYISYAGDIYLAKTGKLIVSVWPDGKVNETRINGESWLDMRERTQTLRHAIETNRQGLARSICDFLNLTGKL
jgi:hypothetical protein